MIKLCFIILHQGIVHEFGAITGVAKGGGGDRPLVDRRVNQI